MRTQTRTLTLAVAAAFGATAIALAGGPLVDRFADIGVIASAYAKEEGGASGGHTSGTSGQTSGGATSGGHESGSSSGGHTTGGTSGGHTSGGSSGGHTTGGASAGHTSGSSSGGHTTGGSSGGHDSGGSSGGHTTGGASGGHTSGGSSGGHTTGGDSGHASGGKGGPSTASHRYGLERAEHGTKAGHQGHASGVHGANAKHGLHGASAHLTGSDRRFGGGSGIAGLEGVLEGPARFADNTTLSLTDSREPGPKFQFRYWGGWTVPDDGGGGVPTPTIIITDSSEAVPAGGGGGPLAGVSLPSGARCDGVGANMPTRSFFTTSNLSRLDAARMELDPEAIGNRRGLDPTLMANVQEALVDGRPDPVLIGTYLGMMSRGQVTPDAVKRVSYRLCAPMTDEQATEIAQAAEEVRITAQAD